MGDVITGSGSWAQRIGRHILPDGRVVVPPRIAFWLEKQAGVTDNRRIVVRGNDPAAYEVLMALHIAALTHRSGVGTKVTEQQGYPEESNVWMTTITAAERMGVTDRAIRKWIAVGKLPAIRHGGRWLINHNNIRALALTS